MSRHSAHAASLRALLALQALWRCDALANGAAALSRRPDLALRQIQPARCVLQSADLEAKRLEEAARIPHDSEKVGFLSGTKSSPLQTPEARDTLQLQTSEEGRQPSEMGANLWLWRGLMLAITISWGCNFAVIKLALDSLGDSASASAIFMAARFGVASLLMAPFVFRASSKEVLTAGFTVGALCAAGYMCQTASLAMGTAAGTSAFLCSLQSVVVALLVARHTGVVEKKTWTAIALAVAGVGCLELPSVVANGGGFCVGDLVAFGQPIGFGASYVVLERAASQSTDEDALPLAAFQCFVIGATTLIASSVIGGQSPLDLDWELMLPNLDPSLGLLEQWAVPGAVLYTGVISTALTIWLQAKVFANLPALDASLVLTTEPLWAALCAVLLLGDTLTTENYVGGALILGSLAVQNGLLSSLSTDKDESDNNLLSMRKD
ncbi:MAG: hypothetical protein SGPRY_001488 [Prymnesium sp.]